MLDYPQAVLQADAEAQTATDWRERALNAEPALAESAVDAPKDVTLPATFPTAEARFESTSLDSLRLSLFDATKICCIGSRRRIARRATICSELWHWFGWMPSLLWPMQLLTKRSAAQRWPLVAEMQASPKHPASALASSRWWRRAGVSTGILAPPTFNRLSNGIDWFRWYHGSVTDSKFQLVARKAGTSLPDVFAVLTFLLEAASATTPRGSYGQIDAEAVDYLFNFPDTETRTDSIIAALEGRCMLADERIAD